VALIWTARYPVCGFYIDRTLGDWDVPRQIMNDFRQNRSMLGFAGNDRYNGYRTTQSKVGACF